MKINDQFNIAFTVNIRLNVEWAVFVEDLKLPTLDMSGGLPVF